MKRSVDVFIISWLYLILIDFVYMISLLILRSVYGYDEQSNNILRQKYLYSRCFFSFQSSKTELHDNKGNRYLQSSQLTFREKNPDYKLVQCLPEKLKSW